MRKQLKILLFLVLLLLPVIARFIWFFPGTYEPPTISEIDYSEISTLRSDYQSFDDQPMSSNAHVVIDLSHANRLVINDLDPLRDRLEARGVTITAYDGSTGSLVDQLRDATALVVLAPTEEFAESQELDAILQFVEDGGRLLLAADPTRPAADSGVGYDDSGFPFLLPRVSAIPATNSLANAFDVSYFRDYIYNTHDNESNYRNVRFTNFSEAHPLTEGLENVVFYSAHSLQSRGIPLVMGDENTLSPVRVGETNLVVAYLTADEQVLALGDITFMTVPFHRVGDNDRFLSNIADWLALSERQRDDLEDFPLLFSQPVELVQVSGNLLDPRLVNRTDELQALFDDANLALSLSLLAPDLIIENGQLLELETQETKPVLELNEVLTPGHDSLLVGSFEHLAPTLQNYLTSTFDITVTMIISVEDVDLGSPEEVIEEDEEVAPSPVSEESDMAAEDLDIPIGEPFPELDAIYQGSVGLNDMISGTLAENESHLWSFSDGPAVIDIILTPAEDLDAVLVVYDSDGELVESEDLGGLGNEEMITGLVITGDEPYGIVVRNYFTDRDGEGGDYSLSVTESGSAPVLDLEEPAEPEVEEVSDGGGSATGIIEIEDMGVFAFEGTIIFLVDRSNGRLIITVLAENGELVLEGLSMLVNHDFANCVERDRITICSTGELQEGVGFDATFEPSEDTIDQSDEEE